jgi:hypothetical protein
LGNFNITHPYVFKILEKYTILYNRGFELVMLWCPSHVGVMGNERADLLAKEALSFTACDVRISTSDFKPITLEFYKERWQEQWNMKINYTVFSKPLASGRKAPGRSDVRRLCWPVPVSGTHISPTALSCAGRCSLCASPAKAF